MAVMNEWAKAALKKGRREGMKKGREEAKEAIVSAFLSVVRDKLGSLPAALERQVRNLTPARLGALGGALSSLSSPSDLKVWLKQNA